MTATTTLGFLPRVWRYFVTAWAGVVSRPVTATIITVALVLTVPTIIEPATIPNLAWGFLSGIWRYFLTVWEWFVSVGREIIP